jgi:hypothetical protein
VWDIPFEAICLDPSGSVPSKMPGRTGLELYGNRRIGGTIRLRRIKPHLPLRHRERPHNELRG